ncbi:hypothetical protein GHK68_24420 [Sinorhizobium meliloti]|uniref:hypothetical protein n=1 Tax=Rhizobium meliloti TaxID=382 RepID=UPI0012948BFC|nr:hypothetical protein [Sinorhizobium meliloti]MQW45319.1 hypothetical protein [Sinorhizobium meliloti]
MAMNVNPSDIVDNLKAMGYGASHYSKEPDGDKAGINRVYIEAGSKHVKAYVDLAGEVPAFKVWAEFPDGHKPGGGKGEALHGSDLKAHNATVAGHVRDALKAPALAAYMVAADGGDLEAVREGFGLKNTDKRYAPYEPKADSEAEQKAPAAAPAAAPGM